jgi:hypothetical protein
VKTNTGGLTDGQALGYSSVTDFKVEASPVDEQNSPLNTLMLGDVQLDEILPHSDGCSHEFKMIGGSLVSIQRVGLTCGFAACLA